MIPCFFASDLHGKPRRWDALFNAVEEETPRAVFLGGDLLPNGYSNDAGEFVEGYLYESFKRLKDKLGERYPKVFLILGNDDPRIFEALFVDIEKKSGVWKYIHNRRIEFRGFDVYGLSYIPPTPFRLKDWERYDVSRFVDPGCVHPADGSFSVEVSPRELEYETIETKLEWLVGEKPTENAVFLFHSPPYKCKLDRAALDGKKIDGVPLDPHIGSVAVKKFIEKKRPRLLMCGHAHESSRLTGDWSDRFGETVGFNAAFDGNALSLIKFDLQAPENAERKII